MKIARVGEGVALRALLLMLVGGVVTLAGAGELKVIQAHKTQDLVVTISSESGQWTKGDNSFVLEFMSAKTRQPMDVGSASLSTSMTMPGMAPMLAGAILTPDKTPGRYAGTITFPDSGTRQVTVRWDGPAGKGSTKFSAPVR